jgi:hypothetical protein
VGASAARQLVPKPVGFAPTRYREVVLTVSKLLIVVTQGYVAFFTQILRAEEDPADIRML